MLHVVIHTAVFGVTKCIIRKSMFDFDDTGDVC